MSAAIRIFKVMFGSMGSHGGGGVAIEPPVDSFSRILPNNNRRVLPNGNVRVVA